MQNTNARSGTTGLGHALALVLVLAGAGCTKPAPAPAACLDAATGMLHVAVRNAGTTPMQVPAERPDVGCCKRAGLTIAVTDASGRDLDRCGFADNFDTPRLQTLRSGETIEYQLDATLLSRVYCQADVGRHYVSVHDGSRPLGIHAVAACAATARPD